jgi:hypothetical protein
VRLVDKNSDADANTSTLSPTERIKLLRAVRTDASSSMTKTTGGAVGLGVITTPVNAQILLKKKRAHDPQKENAISGAR